MLLGETLYFNIIPIPVKIAITAKPHSGNELEGQRDKLKWMKAKMSAKGFKK
jgi:hypothetical protein